jgi:hypothetical protein
MRYEEAAVADRVWVRGNHIGAQPYYEYHAVCIETMFQNHCGVMIDCADVAVTTGGQKWHVDLEWLQVMGGRTQAEHTDYYNAGVRDGYQARDIEWGAALASHVPAGVDPMDAESVAAFLGDVSVDVVVTAERVTKIFKCLEDMTGGGYQITEDTASDEWLLINLLVPGRKIATGDTVTLDVGQPRPRLPSGVNPLWSPGGAWRPGGHTVPSSFTMPNSSTVKITNSNSTNSARGGRLHELLEKSSRGYLLTSEEQDELRRIADDEAEQIARPPSKSKWRKFLSPD